MRNKHFLSKILLIMFTALLVTCSTSVHIDILEGTEACSPPCWLGIQPGVTEVDEMIEVLKDYEEREGGTFTILDSGIFRWQSDRKNNSYLYSNNDGIISKIDVDLRPSSISLNDIVNLFGEPSSLIAGKISDGYFFFSIYYPEQGLAFVVAGEDNFSSSQSTLNFMVEPTQTVIKSVFFQPSDVTSMVHLLYGENIVDEALLDVQDWKGYGNYSE